MKRSVVIACIIMISMLPGCASRLSVSCIHRTDSVNQLWQTLEAKWFDIPIPLDARRSALSELDQGGYHVRYILAHAILKDIYQWYIQEMDAHGWYKTIEYSSSIESLLSFEKPTKRCFIILKSEHSSIILSLFYHELSDQEIAQLKTD